MVKDEIRQCIDQENGKDYSYNINLDGYVFTKNGSFIVFQLKNVDDVSVCHIKYIYVADQKDFVTIMVNCCNFWMGNNVQFIFYKEKKKLKNSPINFLKELGFKIDVVDNPEWKVKFDCLRCNSKECKCPLYILYK